MKKRGTLGMLITVALLAAFHPEGWSASFDPTRPSDFSVARDPQSGSVVPATHLRKNKRRGSTPRGKTKKVNKTARKKSSGKKPSIKLTGRLPIL